MALGRVGREFFTFRVFYAAAKAGWTHTPRKPRNLSGQSPSILLHKTVRSLKVPTGDFIVSLRFTNANFPSMCFEKVRPYFPAFFSRNWLNFFCGTGDSRLSFQKIVDTVGGVMYSPLIYSHRGCTINITL